MRGRTLAGRYRLDAPLGRGGMGEVWKAADLRLNRAVAVKILSVDGVPDQAVARFRREAEIAGNLQHPGIAVVFDVGTDGDVLFLVMELLNGVDLAKVARDHPDGMPIGRAVSLLTRIADALGEAHANGIVHRDVKPANVMVLDGDRTKILDFGIARYSEQTSDLTGSAVIGTPAFMAPEQFDRTGRVDPRTDLYALGALAYELLTGRRPFTADTIRQLLHDVLFTPAPAVGDTRPDVPQALDDLVTELLAKEPGDRPDDARTVAGRLRAITPDSAPAGAKAEPVPARTASHSPVETAPVPLPPRTKALRKSSPVRRRVRRGVALLLTLLLALPLVSCLAVTVAYSVNPGGRLLDEGEFRAKPTCEQIRPDEFSSAALKEPRSAGSCLWVIEKGEKDPYDWTWRSRTLVVVMSRHPVKPRQWKSAPEVAAERLSETWGYGRKEPRPSLGPGAYFSSNPVDFHQMVAFRISNLIVEVRYSEILPPGEDEDFAELKAEVLELAAEVAARIKAMTSDAPAGAAGDQPRTASGIGVSPVRNPMVRFLVVSSSRTEAATAATSARETVLSATSPLRVRTSILPVGSSMVSMSGARIV